MPPRPRVTTQQLSGILQARADGNVADVDTGTLMIQQRARELRKEIEQEKRAQAQEEHAMQQRKTRRDQLQQGSSVPTSSQQHGTVGSAVGSGGGAGGAALMTKEAREQEKRYRELQLAYEDLVEENQRLKSVIKKRTEFHEEQIELLRSKISSLSSKLQEMNYSKLTDDEHMRDLRNLNKQIIDRIDHMHERTQDKLAVQERHLLRQFQSDMSSLEKELVTERRKKESGLEEFMTERQVLLDERNSYYEKAVRLSELVEKLKEESVSIRLKFESQRDENKIMTRQLSLLRKENDDFRRTIEDLKKDVSRLHDSTKQFAAEAPQSTSKSSEKHAPQTPEESSRIRKYVELNQKMKRIIDQGKKNFKQARNAYFSLLSERTELEKFLRQCIDDVKDELALQRRQVSPRRRDVHPDILGTQEFSVPERQHVIELLLSKERVLTLLYEKTFPHHAELAGIDHSMRDDEIDFEGDDDYDLGEHPYLSSHPHSSFEGDLDDYPEEANTSAHGDEDPSHHFMRGWSNQAQTDH